jgi:hypothetical protein
MLRASATLRLPEDSSMITPLLLLCTLPSSPLPLDATNVPVAFPSFAPAAPVSDDLPPLEYTYVEAEYVSRDSKALGETLTGWDLTGSLELPMNFFLQATGHNQSDNAELKGYRVGGGWHFGLASRIDAYAILSYEHLELSGSSSNSTNDAASGELGLRLMLTHAIEVNGRLLWADIGDRDPGGGLGARYYLMSRLSVGARYDRLGQDDQVSAGLRFEF